MVRADKGFGEYFGKCREIGCDRVAVMDRKAVVQSVLEYVARAPSAPISGRKREREGEVEEHENKRQRVTEQQDLRRLVLDDVLQRGKETWAEMIEKLGEESTRQENAMVVEGEDEEEALDSAIAQRLRDRVSLGESAIESLGGELEGDVLSFVQADHAISAEIMRRERPLRSRVLSTQTTGKVRGALCPVMMPYQSHF